MEMGRETERLERGGRVEEEEAGEGGGGGGRNETKFSLAISVFLLQVPRPFH